MVNAFFFQTLPPLSLYVHVPWCVRKCPYCDFNSHEAADGIPEAAYIDALIADLEQELPAVWGRPVVSVFIGGGTPSLLSGEAIDALLCAVRARLKLLPGAEITLEANPGTVEQERFREFRAAGVNRLSIGVQSFADDMLARIGRIHGGAEAVRAAEAAHAAGFDNFNLDLMFGLPGQDLDGALADLRQAIALAPTHLSWYQLTLEPNTAFHHAPPVLPDDDLRYDMQVRGQSLLAGAGFANYEVSAYARDGFRCRHNLNYWQFGDYLGIGAGAHQKLTLPQPARIERTAKRRHPRDYLAGAGGAERIASHVALTREDAAFEFVMNALRLNEGFATRLFEERTGLPLKAIETPLHEAEARGLLSWDVQVVRPTALGRLHLNTLLELFLAE
ncbi:MAG: radical SAM family heme chaperone HemW [Gammaproteobacteria bacterium]|nr:radical SAM family heme chaperone HemW [Gammaproteobacteria bacterium]